MGLFDIFKSKKSKSFGTMHGIYINDWTDGFKTDHKGLSDFVNKKLDSMPYDDFLKFLMFV